MRDNRVTELIDTIPSGVWNDIHVRYSTGSFSMTRLGSVTAPDRRRIVAAVLAAQNTVNLNAEADRLLITVDQLRADDAGLREQAERLTLNDADRLSQAIDHLLRHDAELRRLKDGHAGLSSLLSERMDRIEADILNHEGAIGRMATRINDAERAAPADAPAGFYTRLEQRLDTFAADLVGHNEAITEVNVHLDRHDTAVTDFDNYLDRHESRLDRLEQFRQDTVEDINEINGCLDEIDADVNAEKDEPVPGVHGGAPGPGYALIVAHPTFPLAGQTKYALSGEGMLACAWMATHPNEVAEIERGLRSTSIGGYVRLPITPEFASNLQAELIVDDLARAATLDNEE